MLKNQLMKKKSIFFTYYMGEPSYHTRCGTSIEFNGNAIALTASLVTMKSVPLRIPTVAPPLPDNSMPTSSLEISTYYKIYKRGLCKNIRSQMMKMQRFQKV